MRPSSWLQPSEPHASSLPIVILLCREASPGKLGPLEDELFQHSEMADAPIVMAVALGYADSQRSVGLAFANLTTRHLGACEFADDEQFCSLEAVLLQVAAKEVVVAKVRLSFSWVAGSLMGFSLRISSAWCCHSVQWGSRG